MNIDEDATDDALKRRIRVLYSLPDGAQSSVLLRTTHLRRLIEARDVDWTFVSPLAGDAEFAAEFREAGVDVVEWPKVATPSWERLLLVLRQEFWRRRIDNESSKIYAERSRWFAPKRYHVNRWAIPLLRLLPGIESGLAWGDQTFAGDGGWNALLRTVRPDVIVAGSATVKPQELPLVRAARRAKLPTLGIVPSWDNLTTKGLWAQFDHLVVWNENMRREATDLFGYASSSVSISGPAQFDPHFRACTPDDRHRFFARRRLDPSRKLLTYAGVPAVSCPLGRNYVELLAKLIAEDRLPAKCQLLVRLHPQDDPSQYRDLDQCPHVHIERPGTYSGESSGLEAILAYKPTHDDTRRLTETLTFSDVLLNVNSTVTVEACALNCPVVNIGFNWPEDADFLDIGMYLNTTHFSQITNSGATFIARSVEGLIEGIQEALFSPQSRALTRAQLYRRFDPYGDGKAADRLSDCVLQFVREQAGRPELSSATLRAA